ncbi:MAG: signal peptidase I, partial [Peptostreptococcaceae bacterium]|nr:signal peptidase I [Peptostreptococcaceae bacterium]
IDIIIPENYFFTMGDNRPISRDSRDVEVGVVNKDEIIGRVSLRLFPFDNVGKIN